MIHMTPLVVGMLPNTDDNLQEQWITVGNGTEEITTMKVTINKQMVSKNNISFGTAVLNDVAYSPQMKYNLWSLSKLMDDGWKMNGDAIIVHTNIGFSLLYKWIV